MLIAMNSGVLTVVFRFVSILILSCFLSACERSEPENKIKNIFGDDNRILLADQPTISSAMVRIDSGCSGVFIGKGLVLTAAHCLIEAADGVNGRSTPDLKPKVAGFVVRAGISKNGAEESFLAERAWVGTTKPEQERERDFAFLVVRDQSGALVNHSILDLGNGEESHDTVTLVGFHSDRDGGRVLLATPNCSVKKRIGMKMFNDCDGKAGVSGAPLIDQLKDGARIVGLQVSEYRRGAADSVTVPFYSDEYANVAVHVDSFRQGAEALKRQVEQETTGSYEGATDGLFLVENPRPIRSPGQVNDYQWSKIKSTTLRVSRGVNGFDLAFENTIDASLIRLEITTPACRDGVSSYQLMTIPRPQTNEWFMGQPFEGVLESNASLMPIDQIKFLRLRWLYDGFDQSSCSVDVYVARHPQKAPDLLNPPAVEKAPRGWYCQAAPYDAPRLYRFGYWSSPSLDVARHESMRLCVSAHGDVCTVQCIKR